MKNKLVKHLMTSPAITIETTTQIKRAIEILKEYNIGFLPITKSNIIVGVITDRDILIRGIGNYKLNSHIDKIMTTGEIQFVNPDTTLKEAAEIMVKNKIRRLVVLNDGKIIGVLTSKHLLKEKELLNDIINIYTTSNTLREYTMYMNTNPHDSIKASDYPL